MLLYSLENIDQKHSKRTFHQADTNENRDQGSHRSYQCPQTRQPDDGTDFTNNKPLTRVNTASFATVRTAADGDVPRRIECRLPFAHRQSYRGGDAFGISLVLCPAQMSRSRIPSLLQQRGIWSARRRGTLTSILPKMGIASTAAGQCVSDGTRPRPLTRFRLGLQACMRLSMTCLRA